MVRLLDGELYYQSWKLGNDHAGGEESWYVLEVRVLKIARQTESAPSARSGEILYGDLIILSHGGSTCSMLHFAGVRADAALSLEGKMFRGAE